MTLSGQASKDPWLGFAKAHQFGRLMGTSVEASGGVVTLKVGRAKDDFEGESRPGNVPQSRPHRPVTKRQRVMTRGNEKKARNAGPFSFPSTPAKPRGCAELL